MARLLFAGVATNLFSHHVKTVALGTEMRLGGLHPLDELVRQLHGVLITRFPVRFHATSPALSPS